MRWTTLPPHPGWAGVEILLVLASSYGNQDKLRPAGPLGTYAGLTLHVPYHGQCYKSIRAKWPIRPELILVFVALRVFLLPLDGMLVLSRVTPSSLFADTHFYTWVDRTQTAQSGDAH